MILFQNVHSYACINLFVDIKRNGKKYSRSLNHHPKLTIISDLYKACLTRRSERNILGRPRDSNVHPVTEIGGDLYDETTATDASIITTP